MKRNKRLKIAGIAVILLFVLMNTLAIFHSYKFTHFTNAAIEKTSDPKKLGVSEKLSTLFFGVNNPRPINDKIPSLAYETIFLEGNKRTGCWSIKTSNPRGTIILFHGYAANKSSLLDKAAVFHQQGYNTLLVDFMGSGDSEGNQTSIGYFEAEQVKTCVDYLTQKGEKNIFLFGSSMGAVAIMKAISDFNIHPKAIILECPFGSMYKTVCARFKTMQAPIFPMAGLLVFWGGIQNGFWAFGHKPTNYAKKIYCPTLLMHGQIDEKVSEAEIREIYSNLGGAKELILYPKAGHENYLLKYGKEWTKDTKLFLSKYCPQVAL